MHVLRASPELVQVERGQAVLIRRELRRSRQWALLSACFTLAIAWHSSAQSYNVLQHRAWGTAEGLPQNSVHAMARTPDGLLWIATEAGLARFDGAQFTNYGPNELGRTVSEDLCCLAVDSKGVLWIGSSFGIAAIDGLRVLPLPDQSPFARTSVHALSSQNGHVVAVTDAGTFELDTGGGAKQIGAPAGFAPAQPPVLKDEHGNMWLGSSRGLKEIPAGGTAADIDSLKGQSVLSLLEDEQGSLWVGTETSGLHRLSRSVFTSVAGTQGVAVAAVAWSSRGVLLGTRDGELRLVTPTGESIRLAHFGAGITTLAVSADEIWAGTTDGLYRVDDRNRIRRYTSADGLPDDYVRSLATGGKGDVWVGTAHGLAHVSASRFEILTVPLQPGSELIGALLPARTDAGHPGSIWAATEGGLLLFEGSHVKEAIHAGSVVAGMAYDQSGVLWFATQDGWLWQKGADGAKKVLQLPLASNRQSVQALYVDRLNTLWIVLHDGLLSVSVQRLAQCVSPACTSPTSLFSSWGTADGMTNTESLPGGFGHPAEDDRGNVLFATRAGVAVADPEQAARTLPVPVLIERAALEDRPLDTTKRLLIPYGRTRLTFDYDGIALDDPGRVRYRIRLVGFDQDWVETGVRRSATYTALPPGEYRLLVQATLEGQRWPKNYASLSFHIEPPFYRRWWFLSLGGLLAIALYLLVYRLRLSAERRRFALIMAERNRLAREVHDTLAQDLVSTGIQLDVVLFALNHQTREIAMEMLKSLRHNVGQALAEARESIGELRNPELRSDLESRLHRAVERKSTQAVPVTIQVEGPLKPLTSGMELELLRITSEAIDNAVRHANATAVAVRVESSVDRLEISVADDGRGFVPSDAESMSGHYGLRGMRERAEAIGANLAITSKPGGGTKVLVSVRLSLSV